MTLSTKQTEYLLKPIAGNRVAVRDGMSHLEAWDVRRHLIRVFGHTGFSLDVIDLEQLYEQSKTDKEDAPPKWRAAYRATVRLEVAGATYTEAAVGTNMGWLPDTKRDEAHDMAIKTAVSQAMKRCAVNLGDQFGLSLYDKHHQAEASVKTTLPYLEQQTDDKPEPVEVPEDHPVMAEDAPAPEPTPADTSPTPDPTAEPELDAPAVAAALADALVEAAAITNKTERTTKVTRLSLEASKAKVQQTETRFGVSIGVLIDRAFAGERTHE